MSRPCPPARSTSTTAWLWSRRLILGGSVLAVFVGSLLLLLRWTLHTLAPQPNLPTYKVAYDYWHPKVTLRGDLESSENSNILCKVQARNGSLFASTIRWIVEEGTHVHRGQLLLELDDTEIEEDLHRRKIWLDQAEAAWIQAEQELKIVRSQNISDVDAALRTLELAQIDLEKYQQGDYEQSRKDLEGRILLAQSDLESCQDRRDWTGYMVRRGFLNSNQALSEEMRLQSARLAMDKLREQSELLEKFTYRRNLLALESSVLERRRRVEVVRTHARARENATNADRIAKRRIYQRRLQRYQEVQKEHEYCTVYSPQDGLVQYHMSEQARSGSGSQGAIIAQGEPVREGQVLMRIPNLNKLQVRLWLPETLVGQLRGEVWRPTGYGDTMKAVLCATPGLTSQLLAQAAWTDLRKQQQTRETRLVQEGEPAEVRLEAYPEQVFRGHVRWVAESGAERGFGPSNLVLYQAFITVDDPIEGVRPDMSAEVSIQLTPRPEPVLTLPVGAVVRKPTTGRHCSCFVQTPHGPETREIEVGLYNSETVEVRSGLVEGEEVILEPEAVVEHHRH